MAKKFRIVDGEMHYMPGLNKAEYIEVVQLLRKNMLYQTPIGIFTDDQDQENDDPHHMGIRIVPDAYRKLMKLIAKHGGWTLPREAAKELVKEQAT